MNNPIKKAKWSLLAEFMFNILPLLIIAIINFSTCNEVLTIKDFLFVAIILFGQTVVKFSSGVSNIDKKSNWQYVSVVVTSVIVIGLVPSCILLSTYYNNKSNLFTDFSSYLLIFLSLCTFFFIGLMGQAWLEGNDSSK